MTDTPETDDLIARLRSFDYFGRSREEQDAADALCREAAHALEATQARMKELEAEAERRDEQIQTMIEASGQECACGYDRTSDVCLGHLHHHRVSIATARREALEEAAKVADAETGWIGEPYQSNMDFGPNVGPRIATAIRALMEKPNG